jgi:RNA polymerase sigma-70 factor, ECF subfamily
MHKSSFWEDGFTLRRQDHGRADWSTHIISAIPAKYLMVGRENTVPLDTESTQRLLARARAGDADALDHLLARCLPKLRRWAHGRLPQFARDVNDTVDLVQDAVMRSLQHLDGFEPRHEGALLAYLRQAVVNRIRDLIRQAKRHPFGVEVPENLALDGTSPLEAAIGAENAVRYERALAKLRDEDREAIILRLEMHYTYDELRVALDKPTEGAARLAVRRALERLADQMGDAATP